MKDVKIKHNPYKVKTEISVDGEEPKNNSTLIQYLNQRFQLWVDQIPELLSEEYNDNEFNLTFHGTDLDYQDLFAATYRADDISFSVEYHPAKEFGDKEKDIKDLFSKIKALPFKELQSPQVTNAFELALNEDFEVIVVATMSAGKSTLINALLGKKLMPTSAGACTATITRIQDDDNDSTYRAVAFDQDKNELKRYESLDHETMKKLNKNPDVSEIHVKCDIPFVPADDVSLVLIDTPGPDNARDELHGKVTARALDESSKMLVLFVMNGGNLHNEAQDIFLKRIAKSMKVGGKQSKERFIFVINKMDTYDEEDDDIVRYTLPETKNYLKEIGIEDPYIFLAAAKPALLIRQYLNTSDEEKKVSLDDTMSEANKLINKEQLHLEKYPPCLSSQCKKTINDELEKAIESNDTLGRALIHSGIRGIEETIKMYVTKYCRPVKITNAVNTFLGALDSAEAFTRTKEKISSCENELSELGKKLESLKKKIASKEENEKFKKHLKELNNMSEFKARLTDLVSNVEAIATSCFKDCRDEMGVKEAERHIHEFKETVTSTQQDFQVEVQKLISSEIKDKATGFLEEYIKKLDAISEEFSGNNLNINLESYVKGELVLSNAVYDDVMNDSIDVRIETHIQKKCKQVRHRRSGWDRVFHPSCWFNPYYTTEELRDVEIKKKKKFVSREKFINNIVPLFKKKLYGEADRVLEYANNETRRVLEYFEKKFDDVDKILADKAEELRRVTISKESAQNALKEAQKLIKDIESIKNELNEILEI